jgi:beta-N-acetylhexosaminidase
MDPRMFGNDPDRVGAAADAYIQGMNESGVIGVLKHFPGHGAADDSHVQLPVVNYDVNHINSVELVPYRDAIEDGAEAIMVGHLDYPALDPRPDMPASLSDIIVGNVLRKQLNFNGVAMTDAMDMEAIVDHYTRPVAAVMAINAGIDMIAAGPHTPIADQLAMKQAIIDAVNGGKISASRVEEAVRRILTLKANHGLLTWTPLDPATADQRINMAAHQEIVNNIYLRTAAIGSDPNKLLPITPGSKKVAIIYPGVFPSIQRECAALDPSVTGFAYTIGPTNEQIATAHTLSTKNDYVVIFTYNLGDHAGQIALVNSVPPDKAIVVALQSPYDFGQDIHPAAYIVSFNAVPGAFVADCAVLYGKQTAQGVWHN